ncbi:hypothetical protein B296_00032811 [Ensete ventricosum]|uniref:Uncharacterized protein n=1 Tax=Ensete ventricosum TaxID=4639 RepID=A0A426YTP5_ENSVE|nr:hypothetical protein B296_00032811 [Ensete ventricosum]
MTSRPLSDFASTGEGIPKDDDLKTLASGPLDRVPSELAKGTILTLDEPDEDIQPDQWDEESGGKRTGKIEMRGACGPQPRNLNGQSLDHRDLAT